MSEELKIEKDVPIPRRRGGLAAFGQWPWPEMEVDDSVFIRAKKGEDGTSIHTRVRPGEWGKIRNKKFTKRWMKHEGKFGVRVWRTE
mgnify:CR=1 FL=1